MFITGAYTITLGSSLEGKKKNMQRCMPGCCFSAFSFSHHTEAEQGFHVLLTQGLKKLHIIHSHFAAWEPATEVESAEEILLIEIISRGLINQ